MTDNADVQAALAARLQVLAADATDLEHAMVHIEERRPFGKGNSVRCVWHGTLDQTARQLAAAVGPARAADQRPATRSLREAWVNRLRAETLRIASGHIAAVAHVGLALAHYADYQGHVLSPGVDRLAVLAGCSQGQVRRALGALVEVGMLHRDWNAVRAPVYELRLPAESVDWEQALLQFRDVSRRVG